MTQDIVNVGILGCGAMGRELALAADSDRIPGARVTALFDIDENAIAALSADLSSSPDGYSDIDAFVAHPGVSLVVECASQAAAKAHAATVLKTGIALILMSSSAMTDPDVYAELMEAANSSGGKVIVPSGAIGGIDAIRAVEHLLESVTLTTTKLPRALTGAPGFAEWEGKEITEPTVIFDGPASDAVRLFPANVNVAATLSLAGIGPTETRVTVVADPDAPGNVHQIDASGSFGKFKFEFVNSPHPNNPKTSYLAALAAIESLRTYCDRGPRIGT
ncbi:MAG: aspartate dehydrogenase [Chloroflexi bacterium]|nr:aspartate dehydrogenase [Chloroflexota bacterium]